MQIPRRLFLIAVLILCAAAEPARASWTRRYSTTHDVHDGFAAPLPRGGFAFAINGHPSGAILTIDSQGAVRTARSIGTLDVIFMTTTATGEIYAGLVGESEEKWNARIVKLRRDLTAVWTRRVAAAADGERIDIRGGAATRDGGVVLIGRREGGSLVVKLDGRGNVQWSVLIDESGPERPRTIRQAPDGGYVVAGEGRYAWMARLASDGALVWQKRYIPVRAITSLVVEPDGSIVCVGDLGGTALIARIDREGNSVWSKASRRIGDGLAVVRMANTHAVAFRSGESLEDGMTRSLLHLVAVRNNGTFAWQRSIEMGAHEPFIPYDSDRGAMLASAEGGFVFTFGSAARFIPLFRVDANGGSDCAWLVDRVEEFDDRRIRAEPRTIEVGAPGMFAVSADVSLLPLSVTEAAEPCATRARGIDMPPQPSARPDDRVTRAIDPGAEDRHAELFLAGRFRDLEEVAAGLRRPSRDPMRPYAPLRSFYDVMASEFVASEQTRLELLYRWIAEQSASFTARIALANALDSAAWKRRGGGESYFTTASGAAEYRYFMEKALDALDCAGIEAESDAMYWTLRIQFAAQLGLEDVRDVARRAFAVHDDPGFATTAAFYLEPAWGGSPAEVVAFVDEAARLLTPAYGDAAYAWVAFRRKPHRAVVGSEEYRFDWSRIRKGFEDMIRIAPEWLPTYHVYAYMADQFRDQDVARELFQRPELAWFDRAEPWFDRQHYDRIRRWALEIESAVAHSVASPSDLAGSMPIWQPPPVAPAPPPHPDQPKKWPLVIADSKSLLGEKGHPGLPAFLIETSNGRLAVMLDVAARRATPVRVANTRSRIKPLKVSAAPPLSRPVFVIACRRAEGKCTQVVLAARLFSMTKGRDPGSPRRFQVAFAERPEAAITGAAVVDESGAVFGVVIGEASMWSPDWKFIVEVADVGDALPSPNP
jgi:hypothetical protein